MYPCDKLVFRTYQHRIYPTPEQTNALVEHFAIEDRCFNQLISQANVWHELGKTEVEIGHQIQSYPLKPRQPDRVHCNAHFAYAGVSEQPAAVPVFGTIKMGQHRMLPKGAYIFDETICSDCYGARYYIEIHVWIGPDDTEAPSIRHARIIRAHIFIPLADTVWVVCRLKSVSSVRIAAQRWIATTMQHATSGRKGFGCSISNVKKRPWSSGCNARVRARECEHSYFSSRRHRQVIANQSKHNKIQNH